jgi:hypothetical protein
MELAQFLLFIAIGPEGALIEASKEWRSGKAAVQLRGNRKGFEAAGGFSVFPQRCPVPRKNVAYLVSLKGWSRLAFLLDSATLAGGMSTSGGGGLSACSPRYNEGPQ